MTRETMFGVLCIYLLIGMLFSASFGLIQSLSATRTSSPTGAGETSDFLYYSFSTLTTTGYGDLVAATSLGRSLSITEALIGPDLPGDGRGADRRQRPDGRPPRLTARSDFRVGVLRRAHDAPHSERSRLALAGLAAFAAADAAAAMGSAVTISNNNRVNVTTSGNERNDFVISYDAAERDLYIVADSAGINANGACNQLGSGTATCPGRRRRLDHGQRRRELGHDRPLQRHAPDGRGDPQRRQRRRHHRRRPGGGRDRRRRRQRPDRRRPGRGRPARRPGNRPAQLRRRASPG